MVRMIRPPRATDELRAAAPGSDAAPYARLTPSVTPQGKAEIYSVREPLLNSRTILSLLVIALLSGPSLIADEVPEYRLKSEFIERFTRFIDWPSNASHLARANTPFAIGVVGEDPFGTYLRDLAATRTIKDRRVVVKNLTADQVPAGCSILFISASERTALPDILEKTRTTPVLTIGDSSGYAQSGVVLNFFTADNRLQFEINESAASRNGLEIRAKLFKLARIVEPDTSRSLAPGNVVAETIDSDYAPVATVTPEYPKRALERGLDGWVVIEFDVNEAGLVENAHVVSARPRLIFDQSALAAVKRFRYAPRIVDGQAVVVEGVRQKISFRLEE